MRKKIGHPDQLAFVRPIRYEEGRAEGLKALLVNNGVIDFTVLKSRCMDIGDMRYKGRNLTFLARSGLMAPRSMDMNEALDQQLGLMCGFMFTCGLSNAGARCDDGVIRHPFHGQIRNCPAEGVSCGMDKDLRISIKGRMSEAVLQGIHLTLERTVETEYMKAGFKVSDVITNEGYRDEPVMLIYHTNFGWPLLDENTKILIPSGLKRPLTMGPPEDGSEETVTAHDAFADENGTVTCRVHNEELGIGVSVSYKKEELPCLGEWRSTASGDYVLGIEPGLCGVEGKNELLKNGRAVILKPGQSIKTGVEYSFYDLE